MGDSISNVSTLVHLEALYITEQAKHTAPRHTLRVKEEDKNEQT